MTDTTAPPEATTEQAPVPDRYASIALPDGDLVIYDRDESDGWIQSNEPVATGAMR